MGEIRQSVTIQGMKGSARVNALLDSGAQVSILKYSIASKIELTATPYIKIIASDGDVELGYPLQLFVKIHNRLSKVNVIVIKKISDDLILGQDYLQMNHVILDFNNDKIKLGVGQPRVRKSYRV